MSVNRSQRLKNMFPTPRNIESQTSNPDLTSTPGKNFNPDQTPDSNKNLKPDQNLSSNQNPNPDQNHSTNQNPSPDKTPSSNQNSSPDQTPSSNQNPSTDKTPNSNQNPNPSKVSDINQNPSPSQKSTSKNKANIEVNETAKYSDFLRCRISSELKLALDDLTEDFLYLARKKYGLKKVKIDSSSLTRSFLLLGMSCFTEKVWHKILQEYDPESSLEDEIVDQLLELLRVHNVELDNITINL